MSNRTVQIGIDAEGFNKDLEEKMNMCLGMAEFWGRTPTIG